MMSQLPPPNPIQNLAKNVYKSPKKFNPYSEGPKEKIEPGLGLDYCKNLIAENRATKLASMVQAAAEEDPSEGGDKGDKMCLKCNCKNSKCLKLYCECFRAGHYCSGCNCINCRNLPEYEDERQKAIQHISSRNPFAFKPKYVLVDGNNTGGPVFFFWLRGNRKALSRIV